MLLDEGKIPLGILYRDGRPTLEALMSLPERPLAALDLNSSKADFASLLRAYR